MECESSGLGSSPAPPSLTNDTRRRKDNLTTCCDEGTDSEAVRVTEEVSWTKLRLRPRRNKQQVDANFHTVKKDNGEKLTFESGQEQQR